MRKELIMGQKRHIIKFLSFMVILLLSAVLLSGCDMGPFGDDEIEEIREGLSELEVPALVARYYEGIEKQLPDQLRATLHPEEELAISWNGKFYNRTLNVEYSIPPEDYVSSYEHDYFPRYNVTGVTLSEEEVDITENEAEYRAEVSKDIEEEINDEVNDFTMEYSLEMELRKIEDEQWVIVGVSKEN